MKQKVKKLTKTMVALIVTLSILFVSLIGLTVAYFTGILTDKPTPKYTREGNYIYFGSYPQTYAGTNASALGITSTITDENGYYTGTNGTKYAKITAKPSSTSYKYSDGTQITNTDAYFKVEPLKWRILKENADGTALIVCDNEIKAIEYQPNYKLDGDKYYVTTDSTKTTILTDSAGKKIYANNYKYSAIRTYLTGDFYTKTFNAGEKSIIKLTTVDNGAQTTESESNQYACENTSDYVFALSFKDVKNTDYGFENTTYSSLTREFTNTDYSLATGAETTGDDCYGCGISWLRSPISNNSSFAQLVNRGGFGLENIFSSGIGVVPALQIRL